MNRNGLKVRTGESGFGLVRGWGVWKSGAAANYKVNANVNNGLVVADGCGEERDMDFSSYVASADTSSVANAIENASTNAEVLQVMGNASKALKAAHNNMDIDQVQRGGLTTKLIRNLK